MVADVNANNPTAADEPVVSWRDMHDRLSGEGFRTWIESYEQELGVIVRLYAFPASRLSEVDD